MKKLEEPERNEGDPGSEKEKEEDLISKTPQPKKRRTKEIERELSTFIKTCTTAMNTPTTDNCAALGNYVAGKLRKMDDNQQILAEALIQKIITKGMKNQLTGYTDLSEVVSPFQQFLTPGKMALQKAQQPVNILPFGSPHGSSCSSATSNYNI